jgi:glycosyltransferase involved in cell wall biosynthesis
MKSNRVLYISYPLLTVSEESAGGAEQMLWTLEHEMASRGVHTTVAASAGSRVSGGLFSTGEPCSRPDDFERRNREHQDRIIGLLRERAQQGRPFDLIHDKSGSFWLRAAEVDAPILATLHLPRHFYPAHSFENVPGNVSFNCVSESQARSFSDVKQLLGVARNGILLDRFQPGLGKRGGLLWLGRICEEKAPHLALEISRRAHLPITLAGQVYPFSYHRKYFERDVLPRLKQHPAARFIDSPSPELKRKLLREASALLITSQVDETSSLVAMEAAGSGTPVVAFRRGALPEVVRHSETGFVVGSVDDAIAFLRYVYTISPEACVRYAREHFSSISMADAYAGLYEAVLQRRSRPALLQERAA